MTSFYRKNKKILNLIPGLIILSLLVVGCAGPTFQGWSGLASSDGLLYFGGIDGKVYAISTAARTQNLTFPSENEWVFSLPSGGVPGTVCGPACAPASASAGIYATPVVNGSVVCVATYGNSGKLVTINRISPDYNKDDPKNKGQPQQSKGEWTYPSGNNSIGAIVGTPLLTDNTLYAGSSDGKLYALDSTAYGKKIWEFDLGDKIWTSPVFKDGVIYISNYDKKLFAISSVGTQIWSTDLPASIASSPAISADNIFVGAFDDSLYAIDRATGKEKWKFEGGNWFWSTPIFSNNVVYAGCLDNKIYALDAATGKELWQFTANAAIAATPVLTNNLIVVASEVGDIYVLDSTNGTLIRSILLGAPIKAPLLADNDMVYVHAGNLCIYAINIQSGEKAWEFCYSSAE